MSHLRLPNLLAAATLAAGWLAGASPAEAASPWSVPSPVGGARSGPPTLAFDASGLGVLAADAGGLLASGAIGPHTVGAVARKDACSLPRPRGRRTFVVQAAELTGYRFGGAQTVSDPTVDAVLADLDAGPSSELAVLSRTGVAGNDPGIGPVGLEAAIRLPGGSAFQPGEDIEQGAPAYTATLRFDPSTGRAIAAWGGTEGTETSVRAPVAPD